MFFFFFFVPPPPPPPTLKGRDILTGCSELPKTRENPFRCPESPPPQKKKLERSIGAKFALTEIRDLKQSGRQRQGRLRLKNEFLPLIRISKMAACVYRLIRRHTSTSA